MPFFCGDLRILDDDGTVIYVGSSFVRCEQHGCRKMVTNGYLEKYGKCYCGGRKFREAVVLLPEEEAGLREGKYILNAWEQVFIWEELRREQEAADRDTGL